jgi:hypothetical protein
MLYVFGMLRTSRPPCGVVNATHCEADWDTNLEASVQEHATVHYGWLLFWDLTCETCAGILSESHESTQGGNFSQ